jgi:hypothetical protein
VQLTGIQREDEENRLRKWISEFHRTKDFLPMDDYDSQFRLRPDKASLAIRHLAGKRYDPQTTVCVSVGGADGSDVIELMRTAGIPHGVLLEFSASQAQKAKEAARKHLKGKHLEVLQGDAFEQLSHCRAHLDELQSTKSVKTIVVLAMAVLHELELPSRSPGMDYDVFFGRLFKDFPNRFLFSREPSAVFGWPDTVQFRIGKAEGPYAHFSSSIVAEMARLISLVHKKNPKEVIEVADGYVHARSDIAAETIRRILYVSSEQDLHYELDEFHSAYKVESLLQRLRKYFLHGTIGLTPTNSHTMRVKYAAHRVEARDGRGSEILPMPNFFTELVCEQLLESTEITPEKLLDWLALHEEKLGPVFALGYSLFGEFELPQWPNGEFDFSVRPSNYSAGVYRMLGIPSPLHNPLITCETVVRILKRKGIDDLKALPDLLSGLARQTEKNLLQFGREVDWFVAWPLDVMAVAIALEGESPEYEDIDLSPFRSAVREAIKRAKEHGSSQKQTDGLSKSRKEQPVNRKKDGKRNKPMQ